MTENQMDELLDHLETVSQGQRSVLELIDGLRESLERDRSDRPTRADETVVDFPPLRAVR